MIVCPDCNHENIEGVDQCEQCQQPLGHLSEPRAATSIEKRILTDEVSILDPRDPLVVTPDTSVADTLRLLVDQSVGGAMVVEQGRLIGIFTERDAVRHFDGQLENLVDQPVRNVMTPSPETLHIDDRIVFALHKMDLGGYRHLPIVAEDRPTGLISVRDILSYITRHLPA